MLTQSHLRAGEGAGLCPNGNSGRGGGGSSGPGG